ncbi:hypothetical protein ZIOFF_008906 [Zingiber officinale]|uniref:ALOG domain-containing protein n=1 Tax=Zingiber officinale TaxID=94328 RepID=A0A8J5HZK0_ZINOF|nr:hypothetical protein ZIOFF_008906 [Zingiber officinale]
MDKHLQEKGFIKCPYEHALYIQSKDKDVLIVCLYVDDLIFTRSNPSLFGKFKEVMTKEFEMTDIGLMTYYLGIKVNQREDGSFISQAGYAREILKKFRMDNIATWKIQLLPTLRSLERNLRYIKGTIYFGLLYSTSNHFKLEGYSDSDWGGDIDDRKSTTGFVFFMGDTTFTWMSKKQPIVTLSTCEAEYVAATSCVCHAVWLRNLLNELSLPQEEATKIRCSGAHMLEFLRYLDQFGKTRVHVEGCAFFSRPQPPAPCPCPLCQAWSSLDALVGRLRVAFEEANPFAARTVRIDLREVRESQARARDIAYDKKRSTRKKQRRPPAPPTEEASATLELIAEAGYYNNPQRQMLMMMIMMQQASVGGGSSAAAAACSCGN